MGIYINGTEMPTAGNVMLVFPSGNVKTIRVEGNIVCGEGKAVLADVTPVVRGKWVKNGDNQPMSCDTVYCCSICGKGRYLYGFPNFCPNCGARMEVEHE